MTKKLGQEINWKNGQRLVRNQDSIYVISKSTVGIISYVALK
jgi:hypothetical protein